MKPVYRYNKNCLIIYTVMKTSEGDLLTLRLMLNGNMVSEVSFLTLIQLEENLETLLRFSKLNNDIKDFFRKVILDDIS